MKVVSLESDSRHVQYWRFRMAADPQLQSQSVSICPVGYEAKQSFKTLYVFGNHQLSGCTHWFGQNIGSKQIKGKHVECQKYLDVVLIQNKSPVRNRPAYLPNCVQQRKALNWSVLVTDWKTVVSGTWHVKYLLNCLNSPCIEINPQNIINTNPAESDQSKLQQWGSWRMGRNIRKS